MKVDEIKGIAKKLKVDAGKLKKSDLIRAIQFAEGNQQCFATNSSGECGQAGCVWRGDCI